MKARIYTLFIVFSLFAISSIQAKEVSKSEALNQASQFFVRHAAQAKFPRPVRKGAGEGPEALEMVYATNEFYIFNKTDNTGFVIVSAESETQAILAYSDHNAFNVHDMQYGAADMLSLYSKEIQMLRSGETSPRPLRKGAEEGPASKEIPTAQWGQSGFFFNDTYAPMWRGEQCPAGCVATAMAIVMRHHMWPSHGVGSVSYHSATHNISASCDFSQTTFDWNNMPMVADGSSSNLQSDAISKLQRTCGISIGMDYDPSSSSSNIAAALGALRRHFGYQSPRYISERGEGTEEWCRLLRNEIDNNRPVIVSGYASSGHAYVLDGYDDEGRFHFNLGWGGSCNGYYLHTSVNDTYRSTSAVIEIQPGSFDDHEDYSPIIFSNICLLDKDYNPYERNITPDSRTIVGMYDYLNTTPYNIEYIESIALCDKNGNIKKILDNPYSDYEGVDPYQPNKMVVGQIQEPICRIRIKNVNIEPTDRLWHVVSEDNGRTWKKSYCGSVEISSIPVSGFKRDLISRSPIQFNSWNGSIELQDITTPPIGTPFNTLCKKFYNREASTFSGHIEVGLYDGSTDRLKYVLSEGNVFNLEENYGYSSRSFSCTIPTNAVINVGDYLALISAGTTSDVASIPLGSWRQVAMEEEGQMIITLNITNNPVPDPVSSHDYTVIHLKGKDPVSFTTDDITEMRIKDSTDEEHPELRIVSKELGEKLFPVEEIDSISFTKGTVVEATQNAASDIIDAVMSQKDGIESTKAAFLEKQETLKAMEGVTDLAVNDFSSTIRYADGTEAMYLYDVESPYADTGISSSKGMQKETYKYENGAYSFGQDIENSDVVVFDLFSGMKGREMQSHMMLETAKQFKDNGYKVAYLPYFWGSSLGEALKAERVKYIFVSTHGDSNFLNFAEEGTMDEMAQYYLAESSFSERMVSGQINISADGGYYTGYRLSRVIDSADKIQGEKFIYFASCSTGDCSFKAWGDKVCVLGWDGQNYGGQAMALMLSDYIANFNLGLKAFRHDFKDALGSIRDPTTKLSTSILKPRGNLEIGERSQTADYPNINDIKDTYPMCRAGFYYGEKVQVHKVSRNTKVVGYTENLTRDWDWGAPYPTHNGNRLSLLFSTQLRRWDNNSYWGYDYIRDFFEVSPLLYTTFNTYVNLGVNRMMLLFEEPYDGFNSETRFVVPSAVRYVVIENGTTKSNGVESPVPYEELTPAVVTLEPEVSGTSVTLKGIIENISGRGIQKGFLYWMKGQASESTKAIMSDDDSNLFEAELTDLPSGTYNVQAFTISKEIKDFGEKIEFTYMNSADTPITVPDPNFQKYLVDNFDTNKDGVLNRDEADAVEKIECKGLDIHTVEGFEQFKNLSWFDCSNNPLNSLNVSVKPNLFLLICSNCNLKELDLSQNTGMRHLYCDNNQLKELDFSMCINMLRLECFKNQITDIKLNDYILNLSCGNNKLTSIDLTRSTRLNLLTIRGNDIINLDVSRCPEMYELNCEDNPLTSLDISTCTSLSQFVCYNTKLKTIDLSHVKDEMSHVRIAPNPLLETLYVAKNQSIPYIYGSEKERDDRFIPASTKIVVK